jgi:DnaJ-class molecular chaperone
MAPAKFDDLYLVLEVTSSTAIEEIKKSYRRLALAHHPDKNIGSHQATKRFQQVSQ